jgi:hypothetical protein
MWPRFGSSRLLVSRSHHPKKTPKSASGLAQCGVYGPLKPIPHDLAHYVVERELGLRDGLWGSIASGVILEGMKPLSGKQQPHSREQSHTIQVANRRGILFAELAVGAVLQVIKGEPLEAILYVVDSPMMRLRTRADYDALAQRVRPVVEAMVARWRTIPMGSALVVSWPDDQAVRIERHKRRSRHAHEGLNRTRSA